MVILECLEKNFFFKKNWVLSTQFNSYNKLGIIDLNKIFKKYIYHRLVSVLKDKKK